MTPPADHNQVVLDRLYQTILSRRDADPQTSYTASLLQQAPTKIARKISEETTETIIELLVGTPQNLAKESADLLYHLLVAWTYAGITPQDVFSILEQREGQSGILEKQNRKV